MMFDLNRQILQMRDRNCGAECFLISVELGVMCADILQSSLFDLGESKDLPYHLSSCNGPDGKPFAYMISRELWDTVRRDLRVGEKELFYKHGGVVSEPLDDFKQFLSHWDFAYEYDPAVSCPCCGEETEDWRTDPMHPFTLSNANIGGLLVFHCAKCGATIRQKHFKDHVALEYSPSCRMRKRS